MIHRTFRSLDDPPRLVGFTIKQWALLITGSVVLLGVIHLTALATKPAITLCVFAIGLPAATTYVSETGGLQLGLLLGDMCRWRLARQQLPPAPPAGQRRGIVIASPHDGDERDGERWER